MLIFSSNDCTIKDSFSFAEEGSSFDCGHCITSIGTGSLFTNIPLEKTTKTSKLKIIFKSPSKIVSHFHFKDVLPKKLFSGIAYSFECNSCNAICHGKTKLYFYVRAAEHMGILHSANKHLKIVKQSATSDHNNFNLLI